MSRVVTLVFMLSASFSFAQDSWLSDLAGAVAEEASQWELDPEVVDLKAVDMAEVNRVLSHLQDALATGSVEELAALRPYAEQALLTVDTLPPLQPYADWLRQRMDYFFVAEEVVRPTPPARRSTPPPGAPGGPIRSPAPESRPAPKASPAEGDYELWLERLKGRSPPARASEFVPRLKPVFKEAGVPGEIVWLAEVESTFNPKAESPVGAKGLYQFMPATAKEYGLSLDPNDERLDPEKNAQAAAAYLRYLHGRFDDWSLALAAYNAGQGRVSKLLKKTGGTSFDEIAAHLPAETRMYVPKMRAVVQLREGVDLREL